ncbi:MAG: hypothetical protein K9N49_08700, partial [Candidatus Marinimicrobia bacterium]|nr:hypothetical protein [Candidatus Neomarinimicrobiota bacterium]
MLICGVALAAGADEADWRRQPRATLPLLAQSPAIDGVVETSEWLAAAQLGPLKAAGEGVAESYAKQVYVG